MSIQERIQAFYTGWLYPLIVAVLVLWGNLTGLEVYTNTVNVLLICFALLICTSSRPLLPFFLSFFYQISMKNTPAEPTGSDYYFTEWRVPLHIFLVALLLVCFTVFLIRSRVISPRNPLKLPLLLPTLIFSVSMLLNGLGFAEYVPMNFVWGIGMGLVYFFLFYVFYLGMKEEDPHELTSYFTYLTLLLSWILIVEVANGFLTEDWIVNGVIHKYKIVLGFGVSNLIGFHLVTMIPMCFYGFMKERCAPLYLITAVLLYGCTVLTLSRNSILFGGVIFLICFITAMLFGERRRAARVLFLCLLIGGSVAVFYWREPLYEAFRYMIEKGFDDSSRFTIYEKSYELFKAHPKFGVGFFGLHFSTNEILPFELVPEFAHNTVFELLCATGLCGLIGYGIYRLATVWHILRRITLEKWMLGVAYMTLAVQSLLDNYVFYVYTVFYAVAALAIVLIFNDNRGRKRPIYFMK